MNSVDTVPEEHKDAISGSFDEFEWVIDSTVWIETHVGNDPDLLEADLGSVVFEYRVFPQDDGTLLIERWTSEEDVELGIVTVGRNGCLEMKNKQYGYTEFKCRH